MGTYITQRHSEKSADTFGLFFVYTVACMACMACMISKQVMKFVDIFSSIVTDEFNILKINVKFKHQLTATFQKHLHKLPVFTL